MKLLKSLASVAAGTMLAGVAVIAAAGPAAANDEGSLVPGSMVWFNTAGVNLETFEAGQQITSGSNAAVNRPYASWSTTAACPAGTYQAQASIRIPQPGVPENDWTQVAMGASSTTKDSLGRFYGGAGDRLSKSEVGTYLAANGGTGTFPLIVACRDTINNPLGYFRNLVTITGTATSNYTWSIDSTTVTPKAATTTTLAASATTVTAGDSVTLTATVAPASATGTVQFFNGATALGSAVAVNSGVATLTTTALPVGADAITAAYSGDSANKASTSAPVTVTVQAPPAQATTTTLAVTPLTGAPYQALTFTATVAASGTPAGSVTFKNGAATIATVPLSGGTATYTASAGLAAGDYSFTAEYTSSDTAAFLSSASAVVTATYAYAGLVSTDDQTVTVNIPRGELTITTPYTPEAPLALGDAVLDPATSTYHASKAFEDIQILYTLAGRPGFSASVVSSDFKLAAASATEGVDKFSGYYAGLYGVTARTNNGNAFNTGLLAVTPWTEGSATDTTKGLGTARSFLTYPSYATNNAATNGTVVLDGTFGIAHVPSSVKPGLYTATVTFTAM